MSSFRSIQVVNVRWFNATAWYGLELARLLNAAGHESRVVALADTETFAKAEEMGLRPLAMPLNAKNPLEFPGLIRDMGRLVREFRPDVVNCHRGESFLFWGLLKGMGGYALVRTRGDQRLPKGNLPNRILHTRVADAVVATNSVMARHFAEKMRVPAERLHMILGGVDTERFRFEPEGRAEVRARYGFTDDECVVGLLGRFDLVKGQRETIAALAKLVGEGVRNIRLLLLGFSTATLQEEVEAWIREAGMERYVTITGKVPDVTACLSALDVGVVASLWSETIARAALEIMACGRLSYPLQWGSCRICFPRRHWLRRGMWTRWLACCGGRRRMRLGGGAWPGIAPSGLCPSGTRIFSNRRWLSTRKRTVGGVHPRAVQLWDGTAFKAVCPKERCGQGFDKHKSL